MEGGGTDGAGSRHPGDLMIVAYRGHEEIEHAILLRGPQECAARFPFQISRKMPWASSMFPLKLMALVWRRM